ncbi:MAG: branched-chain amino acid ABC transporter permease [Chloroflexota bacterium]|nr:branched-chain amino acid ABC transporter permease [Chloroflexota bacterium]
MGLPAGTFNNSYAKDTAIVRTRMQWGLLALLVVALFVIPFYGPLTSDYWLGVLIHILVTIIAVQGLGILTGFCGQISLGQAGFMAVGAYTAAILASNFNLPFLVTLPCAGLGASLVGLVFALPAVRVKGFYLAITTLAAQFIIIYLIKARPDITNGVDGLSVASAQIGSFVFDSRQSFYILALVITILMTFMAKNIIRTRVGRALIAIRDNDLAAEVMGVNPFVYKLIAFGISAFYAGVAGCIFVYYFEIALFQNFEMMESVWMLGMLIVGGMGSVAGAIFGSLSIRLLDEFITIHLSPALADLIPSFAGQISSAMSLLFFALVIGFFIIFEPRGLAHRWEIVKSSYRLWPFSYGFS